jgi:carboxyl-terminal processing protease
LKKLPILVLLVLVAVPLARSQNLDVLSFENVWETVNTKHYDPSTGGVDWRALHLLYRPQIAAIESESDFCNITNKMLFALNVSHLLVVEPEELKIRMPSVFAEGTIGLDLRWIDDQAVITSVAPSSPADRAGLRSGFVIVGVGGISIQQMIQREADILVPPFNPRNRRSNIASYILGHICGRPDTSVAILYRDKHEITHEKVVKRVSRGPGRIISDVLPPFFIEFEAKRLKNGIAYVRFNHFAEPVAGQFVAALETLRDAKGMIVDLRSNPGGYFRILNRLAECLLNESTLLYRLRYRDRTVDAIIHPAERSYKKPLAVLIDETSLSSSELFAACLQAVNRAVIVGARSPGYLLGANWQKLPNGVAFMHAVLQPLPADGKIIEGGGVAPDIEVGLNREALLNGKDLQLDAAVDYIKSTGRE